VVVAMITGVLLRSLARLAGLGPGLCGIASTSAAMMTATIAAVTVIDRWNRRNPTGRPSSGPVWKSVVEDLATAREMFAETAAPVELAAPWLTLAIAAFVVVVVTTDVLATSFNGRAEVLVPGGLLIITLAMLAPSQTTSDRTRRFDTEVLAGISVAAAVMAIVVLRISRPRPHPGGAAIETVDGDGVIGEHRRRVGLSRWAGATLLSITTAVTAVVVGPLLPGAQGHPIIDLSGRTGTLYRLSSPLVDIRTRLTEQSDEEVFRVQAPRAAYWRVTALSEFDGSTFTIPRTTLSTVQAEVASSAPTEILDQIITISTPGGQMVPAAAEPIATTSAALQWIPFSSTLVYTGGGEPGRPLESGLSFEIRSARPLADIAALRAATSGAPPLGDAVRELPADFPASVSDLADRLTAEAETDFDRARLLEEWFTTEFTYSLDPPPGHGIAAIENFLAVRVGYCEQFAGTFVAMARSIGLAARVAVGYTSGDLIARPDGTTEYRVLGRHAHAWPEVWFDSIGWVAFEPTPGRAIPGGAIPGGVAEESSEPAPSDTESQADSQATPAETGATPPGISGDDESSPPPGPEQRATALRVTADTDRGRLGVVALIATTAFALLLVALGARVTRSSRARRLRSAPVDAQILAAWSLAVRSVARVGVQTTESMTSRQWTEAVRSTVPDAARAAAHLATAVDLVHFGPPGAIERTPRNSYGANLGRDSLLWAKQVKAATERYRADQSRIRRLLGFVSVGS